jgi:hypothetical protein
MRHHPLHRSAWLVPLSVVLAAASCSSTTEIGGYVVTYRANVVGAATIDSIRYSNGDTTFTKVTSPSTTYAVSLTLAPGKWVEAHLYGLGTAAGSAKFTAVWMTATGVLAGDSTIVTTTPATRFTIDVARRQL